MIPLHQSMSKDNVPRAEKIEVTSEMIEAGGRAVRACLLDGCEIGYSLTKMVARDVLFAALKPALSDDSPKAVNRTKVVR